MLGYNCTWGWKWMVDGWGRGHLLENSWKWMDVKGCSLAWVVPAFGLPVEFDYSKDAANQRNQAPVSIYICTVFIRSTIC